MIYGSVCSGIEAASVAWKPLGWKCAFVSEIESFPCAVLAHHYPEVPNLGDMTKFKEWPDAAIDVLVGGTPCQSFSVAGLRKGLADPRGNLTLTFLGVVDRYRPSWVVWENVPGVLSIEEGRAFGAFLGGLGQLGYGFAYRVLDAQFFGVPQRRRRVFVVGHLGDWRRAAAVLFERSSLRGDPAPRREAGQRVAPTIEARANAGGAGWGTDFLAGGGITCTADGIAGAMSSKWSKGTGGPAGDEHYNLIAHSLRADGFDASEDGTGRGTPLVPIPFDPRQITSKANRSNPQPGDICHTLPICSAAEAPAIAFQERGRDGGRNLEMQEDLAYSLTAPSGGGRHQEMNIAAPPIAYDDRNQAASDEVHHTLRSDALGSRVSDAIVNSMQVRRLTPRECERLQGFPDDYTLIPFRGKAAADGPRYKALGNSMARPVMQWLGERIDLVEQTLAELEAAA